MTTIAWDGYDLAADSQATAGERKMVGVQKIHCVKGSPEHGDCWLGFAGAMNKFKIVLAWVEKGGDPPKPNMNDEVDAILIKADGTVMLLGADEEGLVWFDWEQPSALGTGGEIALGAMMYGARAKKAVEIAAKVDVMTGGPVNVINIKPRPSRKRTQK